MVLDLQAFKKFLKKIKSLKNNLIVFFKQKIEFIYFKFNDKKSKELKSKLLIRYIFKELLYYFFIAFLFLFIIFFVNNILLIGEDLLKKRAPFHDVFMVMLYSIPAVVSQSIPFATLIGFLMCLGRMNSDNEIMIIRASGFGYKYIFLPVITLGILIFFVSFFVNDYLQVLSNVKYKQLLSKISHSTPTIVLEPNSVKQIGNSTVVIGDVQDNKVSDVVFFTREAGDKNSIIIAKNSVLQDSKKEGIILQLSMSDSYMLSPTQEIETYDVLHADTIVLNIFDSDFLGSVSNGANTYTYFDLIKQINKIKENNPQDVQKINQWNMELYKKQALPFSAVLFSILAFTISFIFGKHNGLTMGLFVGVLICVLYWAMQITGQLLVIHNSMNSFWCIWFSDIVLAVAGLILGIILLRK